MKRSVLIALLVVFAASSAFAQPGTIGLFSDAAGTSCNITASVVTNAYVLHRFFEAEASQFLVDYQDLINTDALNTFLSETVTAPFLSIGTAATGISITYGGTCQSGDLMILTVGFLLQNIPAIPNCTYLSILPDPNFVDNELRVAQPRSGAI